MFRFVRRRSNAPARQTKPSVRLHLEELEDRTVPAVFNVGASDVTTLIVDINTANSNGQTNTINLTASTYKFTSSNNNTFGANALPVITGSIIINGNGAVLERDPSLGQNSPFRFFYISGSRVADPSSSSTSTGAATGNLMLDDLTLQGGLAQGGSSGTGGGGLGAGGAILNMGNLYLNAVTVEQNVAEGGSSNSGTGASGGGVGGTSATTSGNFGVGGAGSSSSTGGAGGVGAGGGAGVTGGVGGFGAGNGNGSTGGGGLGAGGGIFNMYGTTTLINTTLANNQAEGGQGATGGDGYGGAIFNIDGTLDVITSTIADNNTAGAANDGGAIYNLSMGTTSSGSGVASTVTLTDSILADSSGSNDLVNDENSSTNGSAVVNATMPNIVTSSNTIDGATTNGTPMSSDPQLSPLSNNGGQTPTMALQSGSPALGAGATGANVPTIDQRGVARGSVIDLGAYQSTSTSAVATTLAFTISAPAITSGASVTITATVTQASGSTVPAGTVQFVDSTTGTRLGSVTLSNGQATLTTTSVSSGDTITGTYASSNGMGSSSASATVAAASSNGGSTSSSSGGSTPSTASSSTANQQWLNQVYQTLLHRPIDSTGLNAWGADLNAGTSPTQVVYDIEQTSEYQTDEIEGAFQKLLGVAAPSSAVTYLVGLMQGGADFQTIEAIIVGSPEFYSAVGGTNATFLNTLYEDFLNRPVDQTSETAWNTLLKGGYKTTQVALGVLSSTEYLSELVNQDYQTYMGVAPDSTSLSAFVTALQQGTTTNDKVVASLLGSPEYMAQYADS